MAQTTIAPTILATEPRNAVTDLSRSRQLIDPTAGNALKQYHEGLYVDAGALGGVVISPDAGNILTDAGNGLYAAMQCGDLETLLMNTACYPIDHPTAAEDDPLRHVTSFGVTAAGGITRSERRIPQFIFATTTGTPPIHGMSVSGYPCLNSSLPTATVGYDSAVLRIAEGSNRLYFSWIAQSPTADFIQEDGTNLCFNFTYPTSTVAVRTSAQTWEAVRAKRDCLLHFDVGTFTRLKLGEQLNQNTLNHSFSAAYEARVDGSNSGATAGTSPAGAVFTHRVQDRAWSIVSSFYVLDTVSNVTTEYRYGESTVSLGDAGANAALVTSGYDVVHSGTLTLPLKTGNIVFARAHVAGLNANSNRTQVTLSTQVAVGNHFAVREIPRSFF